MLTLSEWNGLSKEAQREAFHKLTKGQTDNYTMKWETNGPPIQPGCINGLYCIIAFPEHFGEGWFTMVDEENIFNGRLQDDEENLTMRWYGYTSMIYDGQLKLGVQSANSWIKGLNNGCPFEFKGNKIVKGAWPEFLCLYE